MTMKTGKNVPTELDAKCYEALHHVLMPKYHGHIGEWMQKASEAEKRGVLELKAIAEPTLTKSVGRPKPDAHNLNLVKSPWYQPKVLQMGGSMPSGWPPRDNELRHSYSNPALEGAYSDHTESHWYKEDMAEIANIPKPGGYVLQLKDNVGIQRVKNETRNKGTFRLFDGTFEGTTTQKAFHNRTNIGLAEKPRAA
eukprot:TRINITY_DN37816_c0_g1_i1.p1 TRINITY_DN37816_c0_g1~~TRINITY_DN37816_c0_g1_i1.p1  ORF type:complete len:224 (+),score=37.26 TRINITY_DN37816_c0_g1_i1:85-672(+)